MKSQVLHTVWCNITGEATGEIWTWSLLGVKVLIYCRTPPYRYRKTIKTLYMSCNCFYFSNRIYITDYTTQYGDDCRATKRPRRYPDHPPRDTWLTDRHRRGEFVRQRAARGHLPADDRSWEAVCIVKFFRAALAEVSEIPASKYEGGDSLDHVTLAPRNRQSVDSRPTVEATVGRPVDRLSVSGG